jgi:hypothetical protein
MHFFLILLIHFYVHEDGCVLESELLPNTESSSMAGLLCCFVV